MQGSVSKILYPDKWRDPLFVLFGRHNRGQIMTIFITTGGHTGPTHATPCDHPVNIWHTLGRSKSYLNNMLSITAAERWGESGFGTDQDTEGKVGAHRLCLGQWVMMYWCNITSSILSVRETYARNTRDCPSLVTEHRLRADLSRTTVLAAMI